jgi:hypothetical protein
MPFAEFQKSMQEALGRPVWTHEFADCGRLRAEFMGERPTPSFADILALIPADKLVGVVVTGSAA